MFAKKLQDGRERIGWSIVVLAFRLTETSRKAGEILVRLKTVFKRGWALDQRG
jgi:hypothetical protein